MPTCKLTLSSVEKAKCPPGKTQEFYRDPQLVGFVLVVTAGGKRRFAYQYRPPVGGGSKRQITLGNYPPLHPEDARDAATALARKVTLGIDPQQEKAAKALEARAREAAKANLAFERQWPAYLNYLSKTHLNCPLWSGPISILEMAMKEEWNGEEAQAGRYHRQAA